MSKLINEDWEHAARVNDEMYRLEREHRIRMEYEEWEYHQILKNKKPAIIKLKRHEDSHQSESIHPDTKKRV